MGVFVDSLLRHGWILRGREVRSCHLYADELDELHAFAQAIGMRRAWFQNHRVLPHYDLTPELRRAAVAHGAIEVSRAEIVAVIRRRRAEAAQTEPAQTEPAQTDG